MGIKAGSVVGVIKRGSRLNNYRHSSIEDLVTLAKVCLWMGDHLLRISLCPRRCPRGVGLFSDWKVISGKVF